MTKIAIVVGSTREGSYNRALAKLAEAALTAQGTQITNVDLHALDLPLYSAALEASAFPDRALELKAMLAAQHGLLFVTPEYNGSIPPLLKNAIDWASRPTDNEGMVALSAYRGKAAAIMAASLSPFGGLRAAMQLRQILSTIQMIVIPDQVLVPAAHAAFDADGNLKDRLAASLVETTAAQLTKIAAALVD